MINFQQYKPYYLNFDVVCNFKLEPNSGRADDAGRYYAVNKEVMLFGELLDKLNAANNDFTYEDKGYGFLDVRIGDNLYSFSFPPHSEIIERILAGLKKDCDYWIFDCMWLYIENDYVLNDIHEFYRFFLCKGDNIVDALSLSHAPLHELPDNILVEKNDNFTANQNEDRVALVRLLYEKWFKETLPGRIYTMKKKIERRLELAQESGFVVPLDDPVPDINISMLKEIISLRKSMKIVKLLLVVLAAIAVYFAFIK